MKKRDLIKKLHTIQNEFQTERLYMNTGLNTSTETYILNILVGITCKVWKNTKLETKTEINILLHFLKDITNNRPIGPILGLKTKLNGVINNLWIYQQELKA